MCFSEYKSKENCLRNKPFKKEPDSLGHYLPKTCNYVHSLLVQYLEDIHANSNISEQFTDGVNNKYFFVRIALF